MGYEEDELECVDEQALFLEFQMEDWPALADLTAEEKTRLFAGIETTFQRLECSIQAINVVHDQLHFVVQYSPKHAVQEAIDALDVFAEGWATGQEDRKWIGSISVVSIAPAQVIDAVVRIHAASRI